jgi:hypothetical protein
VDGVDVATVTRHDRDRDVAVTVLVTTGRDDPKHPKMKDVFVPIVSSWLAVDAYFLPGGATVNF